VSRSFAPQVRLAGVERRPQRCITLSIMRTLGSVPALGSQDCQVWWARLSAYAHRHQELLNRIEARRRDRYRLGADRERFTLTVALSRILLGELLLMPADQVEIDRTCSRCGEPHGRPRVKAGIGPDLDLSISHSGELIGVAVTAARSGSDGAMRAVGLDIEKIAPLREPSLPDATLSAAERADFDVLDPRAQRCAFYRYWVRKESVLKATGDGLAIPLARLTVSSPEQHAELVEWVGRSHHAAPIFVHDLAAVPGYVASIAFLGKGATVSEFDALPLLSRPAGTVGCLSCPGRDRGSQRGAAAWRALNLDAAADSLDSVAQADETRTA